LFFTLKTFALCTPNSGQLTPVKVDSVSVQSNGDVLVCWQASPDSDIAKYYIFHKNPLTASNDVIDSVAAGTTCYTVLAANNSSSTISEEYAIGVKDLCDNSNFVNLDYHNTIFLEKTVDICSASILLNWTAYDDFQSGLNVSYNVYASENSGPYNLVGTTTQLNMVFSGVQQGFTYDIFVQAIENGGVGPFSASSNYNNVNTLLFLTNPNFLYLYTATVIDSQQIDILFYGDTAADTREYEILRSNNTSGSFSPIGKVTAFKGMNPFIRFNDYSVSANNQSYVYKVNAINLCGDLKMTSNIGETILLKTIAAPLEALNTLTITNYSDWQGGVLNYEIYRAVEGVWESSPIAVLSPFLGSKTYVDNVSSITNGNGEFCYKIIANESSITHVGNLPEAASTSNESCVKHDPIIFVPNAFIPTGDDNKTFQPVLTFPETNTYLLTIYDRWGQKVFETDNVYEGWNGATNNTGKMNPTGPYVYSIYFESAEGEEFRKRGTVALLR
jgi:gliding motility-associated-like protein